MPNTVIYREQGGAKEIVGSGGEIEVQSGATLDHQSGGTLVLHGLTISATEIGYLDGVTAGTVAAGKAVVATTGLVVDALDITALTVGGTLVTSTAAELNYVDVTTAGTAQASKALVADSAIGISGLGKVVSTVTDATTTLSTTAYSVFGQVTCSGTSIASGNARGVRGNATLSGTITAGGAYIAGVQGKLIVTGTMNHEDCRLAGTYAQLDISAGTYTSGQLSGLWVDCGATASSSAVSTKGGGQFNVLRLTNTTAASNNAIVYMYADADFLFELGAPGGNADWFNASDTLNTASGTLKVKTPDGGTHYIQLFST